ncbi:uncharacterized protein LOC134182823 isoform X2 [Corticium candelabrum]|nr:uncharacterized protein LOC134182823 isoform X2 [Corticium candelabrum]
MVNVASTSVRSLQDTAQSETQYRLPQLTSVVDAGSAFERAANSRKHSIIMAPSGQLESLGSIDVMSQRDEKKLKDTAIYAAGPALSVRDSHYVAAGTNPKMEVHQYTVLTESLVASLKGICSLQGCHKIVIMQNFAFHLFFLTTRMPFQVLGAQCNELRREYMVGDIRELCVMVIKYTEAAATALRLWQQDLSSQGNIISTQSVLLKRVYDKYVSIKKLVQQSLEAVKNTSLMPDGGTQLYCLIFQQKDELAQELRIYFQSSAVENYLSFIFEFHWQLACLNAKWSLALPSRMYRMATTSEQQIEKHEANNFLRLTRRVPQIFTPIYIQGLQGARYLFSLLNDDGQLDLHQFTMQLCYVRWLSDSMKSNLTIPDTDTVNFLELRVPTSPLDDHTYSVLVTNGMHTIDDLQAENIPRGMIASTEQDSELELVLEMSRKEQQSYCQLDTEEELDIALALSASEAEHNQLSKALITSQTEAAGGTTYSQQRVRQALHAGAEHVCGSAIQTLESRRSSIMFGNDSGFETDQPFACTLPTYELPRQQEDRSTAQFHVSESSSVVSNGSSNLLLNKQSQQSHLLPVIVQTSGFDQSSVEMKQKDFKSENHTSRSSQSSCANRDRLLSQLSVLTKQCEGNPELDDDTRDIAEAVSKIERRLQTERKLSDLDRSFLASLVVKYGDQQILADAFREILKTQNLNHDDVMKLCQALTINTQDKTDEQLRDDILARESTA